MGLQYGYGQIAGAESLVFAYDAGDMRNSYIGKPGTNLLTSMSYNYGEQNSSLFKSHYGTEDVYIPRIGKTTAHFCEVYNDYNGGSGSCCPSLFGYGTVYGITPSTQYTYQIIYRTTTGYANANYMYHYEYSTSGYVTEYGLWSSGREEDLGDGWKHGWGTFTSNAATNSHFNCYLFHYEYATYNKVQVAGVMLTQGNTVYRPHQFFPQNTSIPSTGGLLDLTGNVVMDTTTVSHGTSAELQFDGTNDRITLGSSDVFNQFAGDFTISVWAKRSSSGGTWGNLIGDYYTTGTALTGEWQIMMSSSGQFNLYRVGDGYVIPVTTGFGANVWHNVVVTRRGTTVTMYVNSNLVNTATNSNVFGTATGNVNIGIDGNNSAEPFTGEIAVVQIYRKGLTAAEVIQNFNHYKSRFNI